MAMQQGIQFDLDLIRRYDRAGPRYTSYPTAVQFHEGLGEPQYREAAHSSNEPRPKRPLSLYFHIPFCARVCFYCACNKVVTKDRSRAAPYLADLYREMALQAELFDDDRIVDQLHWGGGTPTFLGRDEMTELMETTARYFRLRTDDGGEYAIEIDPREADPTTIAHLRRLGFNRLSLGVQDFDPRVQRAVNRIQSEAETRAILDAAREHGFKSINVDLIYGLPLQTEDSFAATVERIIAAAPDRLSVFNYAHLPERFKPQRRIRAEDLPSPATKLAILRRTIEQLTDAGYVYIGMDHFARPDDELAVAQREGKLHRNFQGYSTRAGADLVAMGITSISQVADTYSQNVRTLDEYHARLEEGRLPVWRGIRLSRDDHIRRHVISQLICHFALDTAEVERRFGIDFQEYFCDALTDLRQMEADGLVAWEDRRILVPLQGRLLIRNVCMVFDRYLHEAASRQRFSKVI